MRPPEAFVPETAEVSARAALREANGHRQKWFHTNPDKRIFRHAIEWPKLCSIFEHWRRSVRNRWIEKFTACALITSAIGIFPLQPMAADVPPSSASVEELMTRDLAADSTKEVRMITVTYPPGGASLPHRHDAQVFVYILQGSMTMQIDGSAPVTLGPGQSFYEGPGDVHRVSANASQAAPAKILVVMIKDKGKPGSRTVASKEVR